LSTLKLRLVAGPLQKLNDRPVNLAFDGPQPVLEVFHSFAGPSRPPILDRQPWHDRQVLSIVTTVQLRTVRAMAAIIMSFWPIGKLGAEQFNKLPVRSQKNSARSSDHNVAYARGVVGRAIRTPVRGRVTDLANRRGLTLLLTNAVPHREPDPIKSPFR